MRPYRLIFHFFKCYLDRVQYRVKSTQYLVCALMGPFRSPRCPGELINGTQVGPNHGRN